MKSLERKLKLLDTWRDNVKFFQSRIKIQDTPGYDPLSGKYAGRTYSQLDITLERQKIDRGIQVCAELAIELYPDRTRQVTMVESKKERDNYLENKNHFAIKNDDEDYPYIIFELIN